MILPTISFIIPTKDRQEDLERLLCSVIKQEVHPDQIVIVDGSAQSRPDYYAQRFPDLNIVYTHTKFPRLTAQRNTGLSLLNGDIDLVCFLDDDIVFCDRSLKAMLLFWAKAPETVGGAVFNIMNEKKPSAIVSVKALFCTGSKQRGRVLKSGYNTLICPAEETKEVQWLFGGGTVWRREVFADYRFDEWFEGTGLCEDLDFSYQVGKAYGLMVVADAQVLHLTDLVQRRDNVQFGVTQMLNRYYFVRKNKELSTWLCFWGGIGQFFENCLRSLFGLRSAYLRRAYGNIIGMTRLKSVKSTQAVRD
ncbi:MAG: glycosyltransferase [Candidatus Omnitrophica bacterium]|nr:glycosyltransferase [Candidatus Omnitrophota bacterium]